MIKVGDKVKIKTKLYLEYLKRIGFDSKKIYTVKQMMYNCYIKDYIILLEGLVFSFLQKDLIKVKGLELE